MTNVQKKTVTIRGIDPDIYHQTKLAALRAKQTIGLWITDAIKLRLNRE